MCASEPALTLMSRKAYLAEGRPHTIRLAVPEGKTEVHDLVYGHVVYDNDAIDDQV